MKQLLCLLIVLGTLCGCSPRYSYQFINAEAAKRLPADSLKWKYSGSVIAMIPVMDKMGELMWLDVSESTLLIVRTVEGIEHSFRLTSIVVEDNGEGLLGATTAWRGYDTRQGALRSVFVREVTSSEIVSRIPARERILPR